MADHTRATHLENEESAEHFNLEALQGNALTTPGSNVRVESTFEPKHHPHAYTIEGTSLSAAQSVGPTEKITPAELMRRNELANQQVDHRPSFQEVAYVSTRPTDTTSPVVEGPETQAAFHVSFGHPTHEQEAREDEGDS